MARLYTLVMDLARARHGVPVATLAGKHGWNLRTVYRDLHALEEAGFPVTQCDGARWKLIDGWGDTLPFPLSSGELLSLYIARDLMRPLGNTPPARHFNNLVKKLALPRARRTAGQKELFPPGFSPLSTTSALGIDYAPHAGTIETLWNAIVDGTTVVCKYWTASRDDDTERRLDPYTLHFDPALEALYLFAWCHLREEVRIFAVHRFQSVHATSEAFDTNHGFDVERHLRGAFRIWRAGSVQKIVLCIAPTARWVAERKWHPSQKTIREPNGATRLELTVADQAELRRFILGLGTAVEVLEPAALREDIAAEHEAAAAKARDGRRGTGGEGERKDSRPTRPPSPAPRPLSLAPEVSLSSDDNAVGESRGRISRRRGNA